MLNKIISKHIIDPSWQKLLQQEVTKNYFVEINTYLDLMLKKNIQFYPEHNKIFNSLALTAFKNVKVVILGQDPYHNPGEAHGLSFSVNKGIRIPPSLRNIFKEMHSDVGGTIPQHGDLSYLAKQGVLLLNTSLTVEHKKPNSHAKIGWHNLTNEIILKLSTKENLVFILWGAFAQKKLKLLDSTRNLILSSAHPSPLSSYRGFFGSKPFSKTNNYLFKKNKTEINWLSN